MNAKYKHLLWMYLDFSMRAARWMSQRIPSNIPLNIYLYSAENQEMEPEKKKTKKKTYKVGPTSYELGYNPVIYRSHNSI